MEYVIANDNGYYIRKEGCTYLFGTLENACIYSNIYTADLIVRNMPKGESYYIYETKLTSNGKRILCQIFTDYVLIRKLLH